MSERVPPVLPARDRRGSRALLLSALLCAGCSQVEPDAPSAPAAQTRPLKEPSEPLLVTLQPGAEGKDSRVFSLPEQVDTPAGDLATLYVESWTWQGRPAVLRTLIDFDIPRPPVRATLVRATLQLNAETSASVQPIGHSQLGGSNAWRLLPITSPWEEATVTWNTQPTTDAPEALELPASTSQDQAYSLDVTRFIARELASPERFHGFMLQLQNESGYRALQFASSDHANAALRPRLVLEYSVSSRARTFESLPSVSELLEIIHDGVADPIDTPEEQEALAEVEQELKAFTYTPADTVTLDSEPVHPMSTSFAADLKLMEKRLEELHQGKVSENCGMRPCIQYGDFDGDGQQDMAVQVRESSQDRSGIALLMSNGAHALVAAGQDTGVGDDLSAVRSWRLVPRTQGSGEGVALQLRTRKAQALIQVQSTAPGKTALLRTSWIEGGTP